MFIAIFVFKYNLKDIYFKAPLSSLQCDFAIVQYGQEIRTELSLLDSKDHDRALQKVKEIRQILSYTKTASAIHHVL